MTRSSARLDVMHLATEERRDLAAFLETLTADQWEAPSLCAQWSVRHVVAHMLSYEGLGRLRLLTTFLRGGLRTDSVNAVALRNLETTSPRELVAALRRHLTPTGLTSWFGGRVALTDGVIHHQDIRRALRVPRTVPAERLVYVLDSALTAPTLPTRQNIRGLRLVATDLDWSRGTGDEVTGPGEALLMAITGRAQAITELSGDGVATLSARVQRSPSTARSH